MNFGKTFRNGSAVTLASQFVKIAISLLITGILSRLLTPKEYGIVAIVFIFLNLFDLLSNVGFGVGVIQYKDLSDKELSYIHILSIGISTAMMIVFIITSPIIVYFYQEPLYYKLIPIVSLNIILTGYRTVPEAILRRDFKYKKLNILFIISDTLGGLGAIVLAYYDWGVYALIYKNIISNCILVLAESLTSEFVFTWKGEKKKLHSLFSFSFYQFRFNIINYVTRNIDDLLIGKFLDINQLGVYDRAYKLAKYPLESVKGVLNNILYPVLSCYQDKKEELETQYIKVLRIFLFIFIPITAALVAMSEEIIYILYGEEWNAVVPIFKILTLSVWVQVINAVESIYLQSIKRMDLLVKMGKYLNFCSITGIILGLFGGVETVAYGFTIGYYIGFFLSFRMIFFTTNKNLSEFISIFFGPLFIAFFLYAIICVVQIIEENLLIRVIEEGMIASFGYLVLIWVFGLKKDFKEVFD